jgi:hypothetical protein
MYPSSKTKPKYSRAAQRTACRVITGFYSYERFELLCLSLKQQLGTAQSNKCWYVFASNAEYSLLTSLKVSSKFLKQNSFSPASHLSIQYRPEHSFAALEAWEKYPHSSGWSA